MSELSKTYVPAEAQQKWIRAWEEHGYCNADPKPDCDSHTIMIPLPNVTGALHMGHCLNGTIQDLLTRWRRMQGYSALWMPGTDHAGIATQAVVERRMLEEEGLTRNDIGRDALVERIWDWKSRYEQRILNQLRQIGASCDWRRVRFTLDDVCSRAVRRTFFRMFCDGMIYRGKRLVNWDTHLQTAVADDEVYTEDEAGHFWTFRYPLADPGGKPSSEAICLSTTRPETMLGDTAVCVHPSDERYQHMIGRNVIVPVNGRQIPVIADALLADKDLGTGAVKVTPAHDPNDYACGLRNDLPMINVMNPDGTMNDDAGEFAGMDRYEARTAVVSRMEELGYYDGVEDRTIPLKYSDRSKTPVEPYLSDQWFVRMDELAQSAIDAVEDRRVRIFPQRYSKTYLDWLGEKRDWCISRQLWWGHRIPVWSSVVTDRKATLEKLAAFGPALQPDGSITFSADGIAAGFAPGLLPGDELLLVCVDADCPEIESAIAAAGFEQDPDVLDTWFSSALWPHATLGWPDRSRNPPMADGAEDPVVEDGTNRVLDFFYPGSVLVTSRDIITLWVARMVLTGLYNMGDVPFRHVYIHPKILDGFGQGMSKSKGNGVDPLELIEKYGTDAVRFTISSLAGETQDVRLPVGYECPHCEAITPQTLDHQKMRPQGGPKPSIRCGACKKEFQFPSAWFVPDPDTPVARVVSERFDYGRNFCNKFWNACRFALMNLEGYTPGPVDPAELTVEDRWILSRLATTAEQVTTLLDRYQFDQATRSIRDFTWNEFCDWYLEMVKSRLRDEETRAAAQRVLVAVTDTLLRLLHPFAPFITEEIWEKLSELAPARGIPSPQTAPPHVMTAAWPNCPAEWIDRALEKRFERLQETIVAVRNVRSLYKISPKQPLRLFMRCDPEVADQMEAVAGQFDHLARTMLESVGVDVTRPGASAGFTLDDAEGFIPLEGLIDLGEELERQKKKRSELQGHIAGAEKKLGNANFVDRAPAQVVADVRETLAGLKSQLESVERIIEELS